jgi:hypothetical protein
MTEVDGSVHARGFATYVPAVQNSTGRFFQCPLSIFKILNQRVLISLCSYGVHLFIDYLGLPRIEQIRMAFASSL